MLILLTAAAFLDLNAFGVPVTNSIDALDPFPPLSILGRDIPVAECINPASYRTMHQIIFSCLATIFACTWVSLHPNVPDPHNSGWQNFTMRLRTMFWALIGPEFIAIWAFRQRKAAKEHVKKYNEKFKLKSRSSTMGWFYRAEEGGESDRAWTLTHGFLLEMHGLVVFQDGKPYQDLPPPPWLSAYRHSWTLQGINRHGVVLDPSQLSDRRFDISEDEINDESKGDSFTKLIVVIQTSWFIIQCVARWVQRLYVTELEIVTLAFAVLNIITYILWWRKPQNMHVAIPFFDNCVGCGAVAGKKESVNSGDTVENGLRSEHASLEGEYRPAEEQDGHECHTGILHILSALSNLGLMLCHAILRLPHACWVFMEAINPFAAYSQMIGDGNTTGIGLTSDVEAAFYSSAAGTRERAITLAVVAVGLLFGGIHLLPIWLSLFSSNAEKWLWTGSTICVIVEPVWVSSAIPFYRWFYDIIDPRLHGPLDRLKDIPHTIGFLLYAIARLILIVLAFANLRSSPSSAFTNIEWFTYIPHI